MTINLLNTLYSDSTRTNALQIFILLNDWLSRWKHNILFYQHIDSKFTASKIHIGSKMCFHCTMHQTHFH